MNYFFKYSRHKSILKRLTLARLLNCFVLSMEMKSRKKVLMSYPIIARINTYPFCNLKCPSCQKIFGNNPNETKQIMTLAQYKELLNKIGKYLLLVVLYDEGEPLLNRDMPDIIKYTKSMNISTSISTNLAMDLSDEYILRLVTSGLDRMTVSIDGITQEIYEKYRVGGNLDLVRHNLGRMVEAKRKNNSRLFVEVQFLEFGFNNHQLNGVKNFAAEIGANSFRSLPTSIFGLESYLANLGMTLNDRDHLKLGCFDLWSIAHINSGGMMFPCDFGDDNGMPLVGNLLKDDFKSLWNSQYMQDMRASFERSNNALSCSLCRRCPSTNRAPLFLR